MQPESTSFIQFINLTLDTEATDPSTTQDEWLTLLCALISTPWATCFCVGECVGTHNSNLFSKVLLKFFRKNTNRRQRKQLLSNSKDKELQSDTEIIYQCAGLIYGWPTETSYPAKLNIYTLYCQKFWDVCLYMHMNFDEIPFLICRV